MTDVVVLTARRLIDGTGAEAIEGASLVVEDGKITRVARPGEALPAGEHVRHVDLGNRTLLPGLINCHVHICLPGDGTPFEQWMQLPDELLLLLLGTGLAVRHLRMTFVFGILAAPLLCRLLRNAYSIRLSRLACSAWPAHAPR